MTTYSQLVDTVLQDTLRPDMAVTVQGYVNETIRELHAEPTTGTAIGFYENFLELEVTADTETGFSWLLPRPHRFQMMDSVWYGAVGKYSTYMKPGLALAGLNNVNGDIYHYRSGPAIVFSGYGGLNGLIKLGWFEYPKLLTYKPHSGQPYVPSETRKVVWNPDTEEYLFHASLTTPEQQLAALSLATNWMLDRYEGLIKHGTIGKTWARLGESEKGKLSYSMYQSWRPGMVSAETFDRGTLLSR